MDDQHLNEFLWEYMGGDPSLTSPPEYDKDLTAMRDVEVLIGTHGLWRMYVAELLKLRNIQDKHRRLGDDYLTFKALLAFPLEKARAAMITLLLNPDMMPEKIPLVNSESRAEWVAELRIPRTGEPQ